jgi:hypothetical protein
MAWRRAQHRRRAPTELYLSHCALRPPSLFRLSATSMDGGDKLNRAGVEAPAMASSMAAATHRPGVNGAGSCSTHGVFNGGGDTRTRGERSRILHPSIISVAVGFIQSSEMGSRLGIALSANMFHSLIWRADMQATRVQR